MTAQQYCKLVDFKDFTVSEEGLITTHDNVVIEIDMKSLTHHFDVVYGNFDCAGELFSVKDSLTTLIGSPKYVGGDYDCSCNDLTTLEGCPKVVRCDFICHTNPLTSLEFFPEYVGGRIFLGVESYYTPSILLPLFEKGFSPDKIETFGEIDIISVYRKWTINKILDE